MTPGIATDASIYSCVLRLGGLQVAAIILSGCASLGLVDNGTHLAFALEQGARDLRGSSQNERVVRYKPLGDLEERDT